MTTLREAAQQALEALELGYDSAKAEANQYHAAMAGYKPQRHAQMDADVQKIAVAITALRAALAQEQAEPDLSRCPKCNGPADNGFDRSFPPNPYLCTQCMAEPGAWVASPDGRAIYDDTSADDGLLRVSGDFENDEQRIRYAQRIADALNAALSKAEPAQEPVAWYQKRGQEVLTSHPACWGREDEPWTPLYTAPPRRTMVPLTDEEIDSLPWNGSPRQFARAVEKSSWEKNHG